MSEKVVRKLRYKNPDGSFTEYPIGANSENIIVGENNLTTTIEQLNTKIDNLDKQESIFLIKIKTNLSLPKGIIFNKERFSSSKINFDSITSAYLEDSHPLSPMIKKSVIKGEDYIMINLQTDLSNTVTYPAGSKLLLYLTCDEDL